MPLPLIKSPDQNLMLLETKWKTALDPVVSNVLLQGNMLSNVTITTGVNTINHLLGRMQQGWFLVDNTANAVLYRTAPLNDTTLTLTSTANTTVSIWVF